VSAAEAYFDSWGKALYTAGIDPNLHFVHHTWRKRYSHNYQRRYSQQLLRTDDELMQLCKWLNERRDIEIHDV
jgi:hypothetical protein